MKNLIYIALLACLLAGCKSAAERREADVSANAGAVNDTVQNENPKSPPPYADISGIDISSTMGLIDLRIDGEPNDADTIRLFDADTTLWLSFPANYYATTDWSAEFAPWAFYPEYGVIVMRCVGETELFYTVITDEASGQTYLLQKSTATRFQSWEHHLKSAVIVASAIYSNSEGLGDPISTEGLELAVFEVTGDWIRVVAHYNTQLTGWVRWRQNGRLLVEFNYMLEV